MLACMDAAQAIADLTEISPQVREVAVVGANGSLVGSNVADEARAQHIVDGAKRLVEAAEAVRPGVAQIEAATPLGSVFVVRDGARLIAATTTPDPTVGLVFYDLKTCLRSVDEPKRAPRKRAPAKKPADAPAEDAPAEGDAAA
jgi:predicted regulator of Ras-like GTPase activity (Roadblock/LC7/MglB family)